MHKNDRDIRVSTLKMAAALLVLVVVIALLPGKLPYETVREFGPIETISVGLYFLFILFIVYFNATGILRTSFVPGVFILLLALREMDFHARFTTTGMFKIKFYLSPEVPLEQKIIVVLFNIAVISYGIVYLKKATPGFLRALSARKVYAFSIILSGLYGDQQTHRWKLGSFRVPVGNGRGRSGNLQQYHGGMPGTVHSGLLHQGTDTIWRRLPSQARPESFRQNRVKWRLDYPLQTPRFF